MYFLTKTDNQFGDLKKLIKNNPTLSNIFSDRCPKHRAFLC